jgi:hypothetical protein
MFAARVISGAHRAIDAAREAARDLVEYVLHRTELSIPQRAVRAPSSDVRMR